MFTTVASRITINWVTRMTARTIPGRRAGVPEVAPAGAADVADILLLTPEGLQLRQKAERSSGYDTEGSSALQAILFW
jgi:hypothetical protein